jgi:psp operon transcriptional activator
LPIDLKSHIDDTERKLLNAALEQARFNQRMAASLLGLTYHQFRGKTRKHELDRSTAPEV